MLFMNQPPVQKIEIGNDAGIHHWTVWTADLTGYKW